MFSEWSSELARVDSNERFRRYFNALVSSFCRSICTEISSQNGVAVNRFNVKNLKQDEI